MSTDIADPRPFADDATSSREPLIVLCEASLSASNVTRAAACDRAIGQALGEMLRAGDAQGLMRAFDAAPSAVVARHLSRRLIAAWDETTGAISGDELTAVLFAFPVILVASVDAGSEERTLPGVLPDVSRVAALLGEHHALADNRAFGLANAWIAARALDIDRLPALLAWQRLPEAGLTIPRELEPADLTVQPGVDGVHLRFIVGSALVAPNRTLVGARDTGAWGLPLAQELSRQFAAPGLTVLALPRPPQAPYLALQHGRAAQREVSAQLFASNAIRQLRASVGEPAAVISAHTCAEAVGGGELRVSLSSDFDTREAQGFRCPLYTAERASDVATMLVDLLHDCRVDNVHVLPGVFPDRDASTGLRLLFKAEDLPAAESGLAERVRH